MSNRFVFICPFYNASATIQQTLMSLIAQTYKNWKIILIDDRSNDLSYLVIEQMQEMLDRLEDRIGVGREKIKLVQNTEKYWEVRNVLKGISMCESNDIVCRIDGDDWLTDLDGLTMLNAIYEHNPDLEAAWTAHRWGFTTKNISGPMPLDANVYTHPWVSSHLKTFRKYLLEGIPDENFRNKSGDYVKRAGDQAIYLPALHRAKLHGFVQACMYHYTIIDVPETYQTEDAKYQKSEAEFLRERGFVSEGTPWEEVFK